KFEAIFKCCIHPLSIKRYNSMRRIPNKYDTVFVVPGSGFDSDQLACRLMQKRIDNFFKKREQIRKISCYIVFNSLFGNKSCKAITSIKRQIEHQGECFVRIW